MPYCDAMFLDNEMENILADGRVSKKVECSTRVFSLRRKAEFIDYLDSLKGNAPSAHLEKFARFMATVGKIPLWKFSVHKFEAAETTVSQTNALVIFSKSCITIGRVSGSLPVFESFFDAP